jgi:eukaryotic-like serine/threonine-protein kinase
LQQRIAFCKSPDGVRIAYAEVGSGTPVLKAANWLNHLEFDWQSPVWRHYFVELARAHRLIRYDTRGSGLSDCQVDDISMAAFQRDLETVVESLGLDRFVLFGVSQGCAVSIEYAARHPERVLGLILFGGYARGWAKRGEPPDVIAARQAMLTLTRTGWGSAIPAFRQMWSSMFVPDGNAEHLDWWNELQRVSATPENAYRIFRAVSETDVLPLLHQVEAPTLVLHSRGDGVVPLTAGQELARGIRGAELVVLESRNHVVLEHEPAWPVMLRAVRAFLAEHTDSAEVPTPLRDPLATGGAMRGALFRELAGGMGAASDSGATRNGSSEDAETLVGAAFDRYRIVERLGSGGMGDVYRARDQELERDVAIKLLRADLVRDPQALERFVREARSVSALNHPNICVLHEIGQHQGRPYLVLELVDGDTLQDVARSSPADLDRVLEIAAAAAAGLEAAHEAGIVHRDIKPANLILSRRGHLKILDFGIAKLLPQQATTSERDALTRPGTTLGTVAYMSPEQVVGGEVDARSDVFSLGAVLYEVTTGRRPFEGLTPGGVVDAILHARPKPLLELRPELDPRFGTIVERALAKELAERYQSAGELRADLEALRLDRLSGSRRRFEPGGQRRRRGRLLAGLVASLVLLLVWLLAVAVAASRRRAREGVADGVRRAVAVLPFEQLSPGEDDARLAVALPDELVTVLSRAPELTVRPFSASRRFVGPVDLRRVSEELSVDRLLTGQLARFGEELRLTLEAVDTDADRIVWRDSLALPAKDLIALRATLAQRVGAGLLPVLGVQTLDTGTRPESSEAYSLYLGTLAALNDPEPNRAAIEQLERSVNLDPTFAPAWAELARRLAVHSYYWQGGDTARERARVAAQLALELDPELLGATGTLVELLAEDGRVVDAYRTSRRLVDRRPQSGFAHSLLAIALRYGGLLEEADAACEEGVRLDPGDPRLRSCAWTYLWLGDHERAAGHAARSTSLLWANDMAARIALAQGRDDAARQLWLRQLDPSAGLLQRDHLVACLEGRGGPEVERRFAESFEELRSGRDAEWKFFSAGLFARCGYPERALELLRSAVGGGYCVESSPSIDPLLQPLAGLPELRDLQRQASLCQEALRREIG